MSEHPGHILRRAFLEPLGIHASALATSIGVERSTVGRLLAGDQAVTPSMAARLGAYFGVPARWWLLMQAEYDAAELEHRPELAKGVTPMTPNPDVLLTPSGVLRLDTSAPPAVASGDVRTVQFANGSLALIGGRS